MTKGDILSAEVLRILTFIEFWIFVYLRETHIFGWSWWWLVVFQAMGVIGIINYEYKAGRR